MSTKRLKLIAAIQSASRQRDGGTYQALFVSPDADACLIIWEEDGRDEIAAIAEPEAGIITWNADSVCHAELIGQLGPLDTRFVGAGAPIFAAARQELST